MTGQRLTIKKLTSGYWHIRGEGPCNWAQPPCWPCSDETLEASFFPEAGEEFRRDVQRANEAAIEAMRA